VEGVSRGVAEGPEGAGVLSLTVGRTPLTRLGDDGWRDWFSVGLGDMGYTYLSCRKSRFLFRTAAETLVSC
jgi:hypothetical protein